MIITKTINADLWIREQPQQIHAVQGDTATRKITVKLFANREPWIPDEGALIALRYRKPDGTGGTYDTMPDGAKAWEQTGNTVSFLLAPQMLTVPGRVEAQLEILSGNSVIASFGFCVLVEENVAENATRSHSYFSWVQRLENKLKEKLKEAKESGIFDGPVGVTPDLRIGTVTTLPAGSAATVTIRGSAEAPVLDLGIPKGTDAQMDATLTLAGKAADAAAVGTALSGKAPAGYSFGEDLLADGRTIFAVEGESVEEYCAKIDSALSEMSDHTSKMVLAKCVTGLGNFYDNSGNCQAVLYRGAGGANASLVTLGAPYDWEIRKIDGQWQSPEWVNPPMALGVEYRTTERRHGKAVYAKCVDFGTLPNNENKIVYHGISGVDKIVFASATAWVGSEVMIINSNTYYVADFRAGENTVEIRTNADLSSWTNCVFTLKYTKN